VDIFDEVGIESLREKSARLSDYLEFLLNQDKSGQLQIITPRDPAQRGAQFSIRIKENGRNVCERLVKAGIICDWREPDIMRVAPVPLYNSFLDAYVFAESLFNAIQSCRS